MKKYLFYDLEFVGLNDGKSSICEFGYILTDMHLNILETDQVYINPNFTDYVIQVLRKTKGRFKRSMNEYLSSLDFSYNYKKIFDLFDKVDLVIGFGNENDAKALNDECDKYNLPFINHKFLNVQRIYAYLHNTKSLFPTLKDAMNEYGLTTEEIKLHVALNDAFCTYSVLRKMLLSSDLTIRKIFNRINWIENYSFEGIIYSVNRKALLNLNYRFISYLIQRARFAYKLY